MPLRHLCATHSQAEQLVTRLIRGAAEGKLTFDTAFTDLAAGAHQHGLTILALEAPCLSLDEMTLLACLAGRQRKKPTCAFLVTEGLDATLDRCVAELDRRAVRLPYRAIQRLAFARQERGSGMLPRRRH